MRLRGWKKWVVCSVGAIAVLVVLVAWAYWLWPMWGVPLNASRHTCPPVTPPWALECWLWEDDVNTAEAVLALAAGYEQYDIPFRTILIDSPWTMRYNDFEVDQARYPDPQAFFTGLQDRGYRVVLWMTSMVNRLNDDTAVRDATPWIEQVRAKGYLAGDGFEINWWKGHGAFVDYTNPEAMAWWHGLQQPLFDWGIDGWKLDGTATLFRGQIGSLPVLYQRTRDGWMTTRGYMDRYYRDEYLHGQSQNPEFVTLARAMDRYWHPEGFAPLDAAPVTWVGDQDHAWSIKEEGLEEALCDILRSARAGYCVIGSDVGGYGGQDIPPHLYIRWAQFSAFCGLFLNGGHGERALWKRSEEELRIIRTFAWLHTELVPYMYSHAVACHRGGPPLMRPLASDYEYLFGDDFLVAPIYHDTLERTVHFPAGRWHYLFADAEVVEGPATHTRAYALDEFPAFVRDGAIVPLRVTRPYTGFGDRDSEGFTTWLIYPHGENAFTMYAPDDTETRLVVREGGGETSIAITGTVAPHILLVAMPSAPGNILLNGEMLPAEIAQAYDPTRHRLTIRAPLSALVSTMEYTISAP